MIFSEKDLNHVAELAHLQLKEDEKSELLGQLQHIFDHFKALDELSLDGIDLDAHISSGTPLRKDEITKPFPMDLAQNAPLFDQHCFKVPKILES